MRSFIRAPVENQPAPNKNRTTLGLIFLTLFIDMIGFGIVIPVLPLYAENPAAFGATESQLAWIVGVYSLLQFVCSPIIGKISDRVGRKPVLAISIFGTAVGFIILGAATTVTMLLIGRIIDGISGGNISTAMACIADSTTKEERSRSMGLVGAAFGLGFVIGPALGGVLSKFGASVPFYTAAALALINAVLVMLRLPETLTAEVRARYKSKASLSDVFGGGHGSNVVLALLSQFAGVTGFSVMTSLFAIFCLRRYGYDAAHVGYVLAFVGVLGAVMQGGIVRRLLKKPIEKPLAIIGTGILAISMAALALLPPGVQPPPNAAAIVAQDVAKPKIEKLSAEPAVAPIAKSAEAAETKPPAQVAPEMVEKAGMGALALLLLVSAGISIGNSLSTPSLNGLASRSVEAHCQGRLMGMMQGAGALGRFCGPMLGFSLTHLDTYSQYGRLAFLASAGLLALDCLLLCGLRTSPATETAAVAE